MSSASLSQPLYPWVDVAPDGRAFVSGPDPTLRSLDTAGSGAWQSYGQRDSINRDYGSHALYGIGKILVAGGGPSTRDARTIDVNGATPQVAPTAPMANGRRQHNLTVLADGSVLATGGNSSGAGLVDMANGVYAAERWDPATGAWSTLAAEAVTRQYHSTALLLPDGRVLSSGGGICGTCDSVGYLAKNAQVFTPPYLFASDGSGALAPRPAIAAAPAAATYAAPFQIDTPQAASIAKVALIRLGAVTHSVNMEQRYVPLSFTAAAGSLTATAPASANVAPPGVYMLFVVDAAGVPSVARMVTLAGGNSAPSVSITQPAAGAAFTEPATVGVVASASDPDGTVAKVEFFNGATKLGEDTTAPFTYDWAGVAAGTYSLTARATDNLGAQSTSAVRTVTVSPTQPAADGRHHLPGQRRELPVAPDDHDRRRGERSRRQRQPRRVLPRRRRDAARGGHERSVLLPLEERALRKPLTAGQGLRQSRRRHDERRGRDHGAEQVGASRAGQPSDSSGVIGSPWPPLRRRATPLAIAASATASATALATRRSNTLGMM